LNDGANFRRKKYFAIIPFDKEFSMIKRNMPCARSANVGNCILFSILVVLWGLPASFAKEHETSSKNEIFLKEAAERSKNGDVDGAVRAIKAAMEDDRRNPALWEALCKAFEDGGRYSDALETLNKAKRYNIQIPNSEEFTKRVREKIAETSKPENRQAAVSQEKRNRILGQIREDKLKGNFEEAFQKFLSEVEKDPALLAGGESEETIDLALMYYSKKILRGDNLAHLFRGMFRFYNTQYDLAEEDFKKVMEANPSQPAFEQAKKFLEKSQFRKKLSEEAPYTTVLSPPKSDTSTFEPASGTAATVSNASPTITAAALPQGTGGNVPTQVSQQSRLERAAILESLKNCQARELNKHFLALGNIAPEEIPYLTKLLYSTEDSIKNLVLRKLGAMGPSAAPAIQEIIDLVERESGSVRFYGLRALGNIRAKAETVVPFLLDKIDFSKGISSPACQALIDFGSEALPFIEEKIEQASEDKKAILIMIAHIIKD